MGGASAVVGKWVEPRQGGGAWAGVRKWVEPGLEWEVGPWCGGPGGAGDGRTWGPAQFPLGPSQRASSPKRDGIYC